jgi:hypothetical protein
MTNSQKERKSPSGTLAEDGLHLDVTYHKPISSPEFPIVVGPIVRSIAGFLLDLHEQFCTGALVVVTLEV